MPLMNPRVLEYLNKARQALTPQDYQVPVNPTPSGDPSIGDTFAPPPEAVAQYEAEADAQAVAENTPEASDIDLMKSRNGDSAPNLLQQVPNPAPAPAAAPVQRAPAEAPPVLEQQPPKADPDSELRDAQDAASHNRTLNGLARSGDMLVSALTGSKKNGEVYDQLDKNSQQSVEDVGVRRKAASENIDLKNKQSLQDPNSPDNQAFRQFIQTKMPALAKSPGFANLTLANPALTKIADMWMRNEAVRTQRDMANALNLKNQSDRQDRFIDSSVEKLVTKLEKAGIPEMDSVLQRMEQRLGKPVSEWREKDLEGFGPIQNLTPDWIYSMFGSDKGVQNRQDVASLVNTARHGKFGGSLTSTERPLFEKEIPTSIATPVKNTISALQRGAQVVDSKRKNLMAGSPPAAVSRAVERGVVPAPAAKTEQQKAMEWLQKNPNDPRAAAVKAKLGL